MKMNNFVASCICMDGAVIDRLCDDFDVDFEEEDVFEAFRLCYGNFGNVGRELLLILFGKVICEYENVLDREKFDYDVSSPSYPDFYYDGERICCKEDLDEIVKNLDSNEAE